MIIEDVEIISTLQGSASYTLYSTVAGLILINWNNVTFRGNSHFTENDSPMFAAYDSIHMTGQLLFRKNIYWYHGSSHTTFFFIPYSS